MSIFRRRLMIANALKKSDSNINYPGLIAAWSAAGKSNDDADRNVLRDLTGNGHDITLNNFAFSEMSGYGGYAYKAFIYPWAIGDRNFIDVNRNRNYFTLTFSKLKNSAFLWYKDFLFNGNALKLKVSGVSEDVVIYVNYGSNRQNLINGENIILFDDLDNTGLYFATSTLFENANVRVELLPEYPDALVFDGVDDYGINEGMPILTDFTIITDRIILNPETDGSVINQIKCFMTERRSKQTSTYSDVASFDTYNSGIKNIIPDKISWLTSTNFNQFAIKKGSSIAGSTLYLGKRAPNMVSLWQGAFYSAYLFDRSLDEQEIKAFIRKYIDADYYLPGETGTPTVYYDFTNGDNTSETRETIIDLSGNGNDAKANNFA